MPSTSTNDEKNNNNNNIDNTSAAVTTQSELDQKLFDAIESEDPVDALDKLKGLYPNAKSGSDQQEFKLDPNCRGTSGKHYGSYPLHAAVSLGTFNGIVFSM